ncbi:toxin-antitoxin system HicB family antitoxin [Sphingomonas oleivorans]|uniref:Toxin-antitoxin system HicB family antitoxin n=1 Tax=Sphingomonas oleivorans TaxID=1735121 RepID=A0A2T5G2W3_9SPHN|nr:toxin-antitoxin system HicB family antitoxin [Sphingomonas oleivorans]PTQ13487.1 toxin-antitoxin system HicB family antitoxin [Sphingomonas oleivorans]
MTASPPRKAYVLRIEPELFAAIERMAAAELRSVNGQIECLLREALARRGVKLETATKRPRGRPPKSEREE